MSITEYYPFNGSKNRLRMGLSSISAPEWIEYEDDFSARITEKHELIQRQRDRVIQSIDGSKAAQQELLHEILLFIQIYKSDLFTVSDHLVISHTDDKVYEFSKFESHPLELISYLAGDDFCLLKESGDDYLLAAASVCTPTYWELSEKMGKPMKQVHAPIANLEEKIGRMIRHFFSNLKPDDYYQRSNWFFTNTPELPLFIDSYNDDVNFDELNVDTILDKLYLRCERQSFRKLKQTEYIVFGIKIYVSPLNIVRQHKELAEDLILGIDSMTAAQKELMAISPYEDILLESLNQVLSTAD